MKPKTEIYRGPVYVYLNHIFFVYEKNQRNTLEVTVYSINHAGIILGMGSANERWCYMVTSSLIGWAHIQNDAHDFVVFCFAVAIFLFVSDFMCSV